MLMKRSSFPWRLFALSGILVATALLLPVPASAQAPSIEGTYTLVSRTLPDGTVFAPPVITGLLTYTKTRRNFNVVFRDASGKFRSFSVVSTYTLTATEYTETPVFSILNDQIGGTGIVYDLSGKTQSVPAKTSGGRIEFKPPFDPPSFVFEGNRMTATAAGRGVDVWERVP
jgi:hypothetical protein